MKKLLPFIFLSLFSVSFIAQNNDLVVFAEEPTPFFLVINGIKQNDKAETNVKVVDLKNDRISVKIVFEDQNIQPVSKNLWFSGMADYEVEVVSNMLITYRIVKTKKGFKLRPLDMVPKNSAPKVNNQPTVVYQTVQSAPPTQTVVKETVTTTTTTANPDNANVNVNMGGTGFNMSVNVNDNSTQTVQQPASSSESVSLNMNVNVNDNMGFEDNSSSNFSMNMNVNDNMDDIETTSYSSITTTTTTTTSWGGDTQSTTTTSSSGFGNSSNVNSNSSVDCQVNNINSVLNAIENESFKDDKMMVAKQATKNKCLSVNQIKQVMDKFTFEDGKLEFAKLAYANCLNKDDYYQVNESFTFSSSKSELNEYISNH